MELFTYDELDEDAQQKVMDDLEGEITPSLSELCEILWDSDDIKGMEKVLGITSYRVNFTDIKKPAPPLTFLEFKRTPNPEWEEVLAKYFPHDLVMREIVNLFAAEQDAEAKRELEKWLHNLFHYEFLYQTSSENLENHISSEGYLFHADGTLYTGVKCIPPFTPSEASAKAKLSKESAVTFLQEKGFLDHEGKLSEKYK
jgi:hypothetical protein